MRALLIVLLICPVAWAETITVPSGHFLGLSVPCASVSEARDSALQDVAEQILRTIGASYSVRFSSRMIGTTERISHSVDERFHYSSSGFLSEIENRIVSQSYDRADGGVVYRMLVHYPPSLVARMRRLSRGAKVLATKVSPGVYNLREVNGVSCVLTEAAYIVSERNRNAGFLSYYVMKVSSGKTHNYTKPLNQPVTLEGKASKRVRLMVSFRQRCVSRFFSRRGYGADRMAT